MVNSLMANSRGVYDLTNRYHNATFMQGGPDAWLLSDEADVQAIIVHHWAGFYGAPLHESSSMGDEIAQIDAMAEHHRNQWGIGPAYNLCMFPSGRIYAVGKHGTHRAHTKGRNPQSGDRWNVAGRAIALAGNYQTNSLGPKLRSAVATAIGEVNSWPGVPDSPAIFGHRNIPTVDSGNNPLEQNTLCPGDWVMGWLNEGQPLPPDSSPPDMDDFVATLEADVDRLRAKIRAFLDRD